MNISIPPNVVAEAGKTRFQVSLLMLLGAMYGTYWLGSQSARAQVEQAREQSKESRRACLEHVASLKEVLEQQKAIARDVAATQDRQMTLSNEMVELNSKVRKK